MNTEFGNIYVADTSDHIDVFYGRGEVLVICFDSKVVYRDDYLSKENLEYDHFSITK